MVFNTTFTNISVISWWSISLVEENWSTRRKQPTCRKSLTNFITYKTTLKQWCRQYRQLQMNNLWCSHSHIDFILFYFFGIDTLFFVCFPHNNDVRFVFTSVVCRRTDVLFTFFVFVCIYIYIYIVVFILCCVFVFFVFVLCILCCQILWIVHF